ncbi:MAG: 50S ribosomal protein L25 [Candidatus Shikimatogenerans bostrichidophilus]|nr:MAG: 50S ribosomal protein L25 [Candidatus Shikimatogenerans bostrichidophilus]
MIKITILKRNINNKNYIPCVIYNKNFNFLGKINFLDIKKIIKKKEYLIKIKIEKKKILCLIKDIQYNIFKTKILHLDFYKIEKKTPFLYNVNVKIKGKSKLSKGVLCNVPLKKIKVKSLIDNFIKEFKINVENLTIGKKIYIKDLKKNNIKILHPDNMVVVSIKMNKVNKEVT